MSRGQRRAIVLRELIAVHTRAFQGKSRKCEDSEASLGAAWKITGRSIQRAIVTAEDVLDVHERLDDLEGVPATDFDVPDDELKLSFFVRVGAAPVLLFVVVTAPLDDSALFNDLTKTVGSLESFARNGTEFIQKAQTDNIQRSTANWGQQSMSMQQMAVNR